MKRSVQTVAFAALLVAGALAAGAGAVEYWRSGSTDVMIMVIAVGFVLAAIGVRSLKASD